MIASQLHQIITENPALIGMMGTVSTSNPNNSNLDPASSVIVESPANGEPTRNRSDRLRAEDVELWLVEKIAVRAELDPSEIKADQYFDEFELDSTEALVLAGELEEWLGFTIAPTTLWYYPTIKLLAEYVAAESAAR